MVVWNQEEEFLIDDKGMRCEGLSKAVELLLDYPDPDFDAAGFAVRNLGWIKVCVDQRAGTIDAEFRPFTVSYHALSAFYELLSDGTWSSVRLRYDLFGWITESYEDGAAACKRLSFIVRSVVNFMRHSPYTSKEKALEHLYAEEDADSGKLAGVVDLWRAQSGELPDNLSHVMRTMGLLPRVMLIGKSPQGRSAHFEYIGSAFTMYGDHWPREAIGRQIDQQPDVDYAARVTESCLAAFEHDQPIYSHVDAAIAMPGKEPRRSRYKCLKTIWRTARGAPMLMITSVLTPDVDIPLVPLVAQQGH